ncbi:MAG TPA: endopeptidase La, partial [candidate division Zixibacteria bacterium]|nr:endopeptidase La [candidate division Zixibacteria bacterium]
MKVKRLPIIPLREIVVFPEVITPILVGRLRSLSAVQEAMMEDRQIFVVAQRGPTDEDVRADDLYRVGTVANIVQILRMPDGSMKVLVEGIMRGRVRRFFYGRDHMEAAFEPITLDAESSSSPRSEALARKTHEKFSIYAQMNEDVPSEIASTIETYQDSPGLLADMISAHLPLNLHDKQRLLETFSVEDRLGQILAHLTREIEILRLGAEIERTVDNRLSKFQRDTYLREKLDTIRQELGPEASEDPEMNSLRRKARTRLSGTQAYDEVLSEIDKLARMHPASPEAAVSRNYIDWMLSLPWKKQSQDNTDIDHAHKVLDEDHHALDEIKERIVEHIAVMALSPKVRGPILCLVGPPGVGKTSLGKSVARALGRNFIRVSLGGVQDEAEIRGHRRTYIGAMPGKIIQQLKAAGTRNPVFLLDEIDKLGKDFRGDPSAALLEALDPEQNFAFVDNYIEIGFDLSSVLFLTTANTTAGIPPALADRMEILRIPGYLINEKEAIARGFLLPKQKLENGLEDLQIRLTGDALESLIRGWTREAGVRELERKIGKIMRVTAKKIVRKRRKPTRVDISSDD